MFRAQGIQYEVADRARGMGLGGLGAMHTLARKVGLIEEIDRRLHLLKVHLPYHESDHVLNIAYNLLAGGQRLEDLELLRNDEVYLDALGTQRIPDPTTAGDQENLIAQLKSGVRALRAPVADLESNGAYMAMASLAWTLKAWFALSLPEKGRWAKLHAEQKRRVLHMEFRSFLNVSCGFPFNSYDRDAASSIECSRGTVGWMCSSAAGINSRCAAESRVLEAGVRRLRSGHNATNQRTLES